jgi:hypothetical protein
MVQKIMRVSGEYERARFGISPDEPQGTVVRIAGEEFLSAPLKPARVNRARQLRS